jgi:glycosyltransferase involved in cell wall biosynthesis
MKVSIVISVFNSHEIVRRQIAHWKNLNIPDDVEILLMDDGSTPPLEGALKNLRIIPVGNPRNDSDGIFYDGRVSIARNLGAKLAQGEFLLMTDIDYIITKENIEAARNMKYDKARFKREMGVLLEDGSVTQDLDTLRQYGLMEERIKSRGVQISPHPNNFIIRKTTFLEIGGYREDLRGIYPSKGDTWFKRDWTVYEASGKATIAPAEERTTLLMFPNGQFCGDLDFNPFGLFHDLSRKTKNNPFHKELKGAA